MLDRKYTHSPANGIRYAAIRCFTKEPHRGDNYFTLFVIFAFQRKKQVILDPQMYKKRQHPTEVECRLFCCPILLSRCRFCSFLKLLSYRHTAYTPSVLYFCPYITNMDSGRGLMKCGSTIVPFVDVFPKDTRLYQLMSTRPSGIMDKRILDGN